MDYGATITTTEERSHTCDNCGAELSITYARQAGHNESEEYFCPECNKMYSVRSSLPIMQNQVKVIKGRTDGKSDKYDNDK